MNYLIELDGFLKKYYMVNKLYFHSIIYIYNYILIFNIGDRKKTEYRLRYNPNVPFHRDTSEFKVR